jgi:hypothetical protein
MPQKLELGQTHEHPERLVLMAAEEVHIVFTDSVSSPTVLAKLRQANLLDELATLLTRSKGECSSTLQCQRPWPVANGFGGQLG